MEYCIELEIENASYAAEKVEKYLNKRGIYLIGPSEQKTEIQEH